MSLVKFFDKVAEEEQVEAQPQAEEQPETPVKNEEQSEAPVEGEKELGEAVSNTVQAATLNAQVNKAINLAPVTAGKSNQILDPSTTPGGLKAQDVKDAVLQAIQVGQPDKILPFVKTIAEHHPDAINEVIKMVKIELHDGIMKKLIEEDAAVSITDQLNAMVGESQ